MGMIRKASSMSVLPIKAPRPNWLSKERTWSRVSKVNVENSLGIPSLMELPSGYERS